jgi:hypothetical protein
MSGPTAANAAAVAAAMRCLDDFMAAFNARDIEALEATFNFPSVRLASGRLSMIEPGYHTAQLFQRGALAEWDHSAWEHRTIIHAGVDKVHIATRFTRYRKDRSILAGFDSMYVVTCERGHWGIKMRSSFAP